MADNIEKGRVVMASVLRNSDVLIALGAVSVVLMMILPLPAFLLDILIALNITIGILILVIAMQIKEVLEFSVFPSLLLVVTLFRLALNVSSTRLILLQGISFAGEIIRAFGNYVVGGNYIVGIVIFLILVLIQFMVITKGATRVAEVAARFTLDAMPGKQMSIDSDLQAGLIDDDEAKNKRKDLQREADFYGAMDGASKFVQGDAVAGIVITIINVIGGLIIGVWQRGEPVMNALQTYTLLTVGDGLVSQIPALLISTATGIIVTRAASDGNLGEDLVTQLTSYPKLMFMVSGVLAFLGLVPGLPTVPFFTIAIILAAFGYLMGDAESQRTADAQASEDAEEAEKAKAPESMAELLTIDPMELEIGYALIPLVDQSQGGDLLDRITMIRKQTAMDLGLVVPPVRIRDNMQLKPNSYSVRIKGIEVCSGELHVDQYLAINPGTGAEPLIGEETIEPTFGLPATWIGDEQREKAEMLGYTVVDSPSVIATHLTEVIKSNAHEILGREEVQTLVEAVRQTFPLIVQELVPDKLPYGKLQEILANLLREGVSIRNMVTILETIASGFQHQIESADDLTESIRTALKRQICNKYATRDKKLPVITLEPGLQSLFESNIKSFNNQGMIILDPKQANRIMESMVKEAGNVNSMGYQPIILAPPSLRPYLKRFVDGFMPAIVVLSYTEIAPGIEVEALGMVNK